MSISRSKFRPYVRTILRTVFDCALLLSLLSFANGHAAESLLNQPAPDFTRPDLSGAPVSMAALRGHVVLLNFWATWCGPCRVEMPRFIQWQRRYGPEGLQIVGVSIDDSPAPVGPFVRRIGVNYPVVMGDARLVERWGGIMGIPVSFLIDRRGIVRARIDGETDSPAMEHAIQRLLASPSPQRPRETIASLHAPGEVYSPLTRIE